MSMAVVSLIINTSLILTHNSFQSISVSDMLCQVSFNVLTIANLLLCLDSMIIKVFHFLGKTKKTTRAQIYLNSLLHVRQF